MHNPVVDNKHLEISLGKNLVVEEKTPNLKPQIQNNSHIMEDFIGALIKGEELSELK